MSASGIRSGGGAVDTELPAAAALTDAAANPTTPTVGAAGLVLGVGTAWDRVRSVTALGDGSTQGLPATGLYEFNGGTWDRKRTPSAVAAVPGTLTGATAVFTPPASKKFRLFKFMLAVAPNTFLAGGGNVNVSILDAAATMVGPITLAIPAASPAGNGWFSFVPWADLGNGILSAAANNVLNINLSQTLSGAGIWLVAIVGTE